MSEIQIAWLELLLIGGLGVIMVLSGIIISVAVKKKNKLCTKQTEGVVIKHKFGGEGRMYPVVEYFVDGNRYETKKKFNGVKTMKISGIFSMQVQPEAYEDEKGWLHVKTGAFANFRRLAEQLWPIGSKMTVYYNPEKPQKAYVDRAIKNSFVTGMFVIVGMVTILVGVLVFFLIQL